MQTVSIIRQRGQLTIPESIRKIVRWVNPMSAVSISVIKPDEIVIRPHSQKVDWDEIWAGIARSRSLVGEGKSVSAIEFLENDRNSH